MLVQATLHLGACGEPNEHQTRSPNSTAGHIVEVVQQHVATRKRLAKDQRNPCRNFASQADMAVAEIQSELAIGEFV